MRVAICDDNQQDIERIRRYTLRMIDYAVEYVFYTRPEEFCLLYTSDAADE